MIRSPRVWAIAKKEIYHIVRDPFTLGLAVLLPVMMVVIFGLAMEFNVKNIPVAVVDNNKTQASRTLLHTMSSAGYFQVYYVDHPQTAIRSIDAGKNRAALIIPPDFERQLNAEKNGVVQVMLDGSDNSTISSIIGYFSAMTHIAGEKITQEKTPIPVTLKTRFLYNPELNSRWFSVPGLMVIVVGVLSVLLTALTVAKEWENGSMELLLSTPIKTSELIAGKLLPYVGLGLIGVSIVYYVARVFLGVPFVGSHWVFLLACLLFLTTYLALGLLISVATRNQQMAMQISFIIGMLPSILLSGFIFPIASMPPFFQIATMALPARWFMEISRGVFLKGETLLDLSIPFMALSVICAVAVIAAIKQFKRDLEP